MIILFILKKITYYILYLYFFYLKKRKPCKLKFKLLYCRKFTVIYFITIHFIYIYNLKENYLSHKIIKYINMF
jgi:hypothetical protein